LKTSHPRGEIGDEWVGGKNKSQKVLKRFHTSADEKGGEMEEEAGRKSVKTITCKRTGSDRKGRRAETAVKKIVEFWAGSVAGYGAETSGP